MLIGRAAECAAVDGLLERARRAEGGTLVVRGEAGIGKTALLDQAETAPGMRALRGTGVQAESELAYATIHQLLHPLLPLLDRLPPPQADAVRVALGMADAGAPDRFLVALGFLSLISEAARSEPVLCVLDDVQWCDDASTDVLLFVGRRISAEPVALLLSVRDDPSRPAFDLPGVPALHVEGLSESDAGQLLTAAAGVAPAEPVRSALARRTRGNPLALVELARSLTADQVAGRQPLPDALPVGDRLERFFLDRAAVLSADARRLLLVAAADEAGEADVIAEASGRASAAEAVAEVEGSGLVAYRHGCLEFCHPLARSAIYGDATTSERRDAHLGLAAALGARGQQDRRTWHLAAAAVGPDEQIAAAMEDVAERARQRSGHGSASAAYERAADLSPHAEDRTRRLLRSADSAWLAGQAGRARLLVDLAEQTTSDPLTRGRLLHLRARAASRNGHVDEAHRLLVTGADLVRDQAPGEALEMLAEAVEAAAYTGDLERVAEAGQHAAGLEPGRSAREQFLSCWLAAGNAAMRGSVAADAELLRETLVLGERLDDPRLTVWAGIAALNLGDVAGMVRFYGRALERARRTGAAGSLPYALEHAAMSQALAGSYAAARSAAEEGLRLARETEQLRSASQLLAILAFVAGTTGDETECEQLAEEARGIAAPLGLGLPAATATWALARLDLGIGRFDGAVDRLVGLREAKPGTGHPIVALWATPDLVEAAARARRLSEVEHAVAQLDDLALAGRQPGAASTAAWCRGLLGGEDAADQLSAAADGYRALRLPLAEARARLALGELLRRSRRPSAAREHLRAALDGFRALGARPWADRAAAELRAAGEAARPSAVRGVEQLTAQELQIVRHVCQGASNRDVAAQLFISPRTVEYHLYKAYPKLGISSRTQLISKFAADPLLATVG